MVGLSSTASITPGTPARVEFEYGDTTMVAELPPTATVVRYGDTYRDPPEVDAVGAARRALAAPLGMPRLGELVGPGSRVAIAFPDRVKGGTHATAHRKVALPLVLEQLAAAGVSFDDVALICAVGLHRKNSREEMAAYLPAAVLDRFGPDQLRNHDAEDADDLIDLGRSAHGDRVVFNRTCIEADLCVVLGHAQGNPYGGFSGGYKTVATGLTTWRSIAGHHTPDSMDRDDFVPINPHSHFRHQLNAIGRRAEEQMAHPFFAVDAVTGGRAEVLGVHAGACGEVQEACWPLATERTEVTLDSEKADVVVFGLPRSFHYGPGMGTNPVLMRQAISAVVTRVAGALNTGAVAIVATECDGWFNEDWFPSYPATFDLVERSHEVAELRAHEQEFASNPDWVAAYRAGDAYHPFHAFSMAYFAELGFTTASRVFAAGARSPQWARRAGMTPARDIDHALRLATRITGPNPKVLALPGYLQTAAVHLFAGRD